MLDISAPSSPALLGTYEIGYYVKVVRAHENRLFVASLDGIFILEESSPGVLQSVGSYLDTIAYDIRLDGCLAYVADHYGVRVLDVSDPQLPTEAGFWGEVYPSNQQYIVQHITRLEVANETVYAVRNSGTSGDVYILDFSDIQAPVRIKAVRPSGGAHSVLYRGGLLVFGAHERGLQVFDANYPSELSYTIGINRSIPCLDLEAADDFVVTASGGSGVSVFYLEELRPSLLETHLVRDPSFTQPLGRYFAIDNNIGYFVYTSNGRSNPGGLDIIDLHDPSQPELLSRYPSFNPTGVVVSDSVAYVADGSRGVDVLDISDPLNPSRITLVATPDDARFVSLDNNLLYVAANNAGLLVYDISDPSLPTLVGTYDTPGAAYVVQLHDGIAYVAANSFVRLLDVSEPGSIVEIGAVDVDLAWDLTVDFPHVYVPNGESGLAVIDVSDPTNPVIVSEYDTAFCHGITHQGTKVYLTDHFALNIFDVSDPTNPVLVGVHDTPGDSEDVTVANGFAYVPDWDRGLQIFDISSDCSSPCLPDTNHDGVLSPADFSAWVAAFNASAPECDQNGDGSCSPADFSAWVANYNAGC